MRCPHCGSVVEPLRDTSGALFCPACQNTGHVSPAWARQAAQPTLSPPHQRLGPPLDLSPPAQAAWQQPAKPSGKAVASLVLGIAAIVLFPVGLILGPIAIVF